MNEERKVLVTHDGLNKFTVTYDNNRTGKRESYVFPEYKRGSKRDRSLWISEDCYQWLKDETTSFREGLLRVVTENVAEEVREAQVDAAQEVIDTTPEAEENTITREEIEKLMKGAKGKIASRLEKIETDSQKQFVIETIKELGLTDLNKLREVVRVFYGDDMELDYIFPPQD